MFPGLYDMMDGAMAEVLGVDLETYIDVIDNSRKIETLQMISINGQVVKKYLNAERLLDVTALSKGIYILKIEMADGAQVNKKIIVFR